MQLYIKMTWRNVIVGILAAWVASDIAFGVILYTSSKEATGEMQDIFEKLLSPEGSLAGGIGLVVGILAFSVL
jgi:hypothetical protein